MQMSGSSSHLQPIELDEHDDDDESPLVFEVCPRKTKIPQNFYLLRYY